MIKNRTISDYLRTKVIGENFVVSNISIFPNEADNSLSFCQNSSLENLKFAKKSTVLASEADSIILKKYNISIIISNNPKYDLGLIYDKYFRKKQISYIDNSVKIGANCNISNSVKIDRGVTVGNNVTIKKNVFIGQNVIINSNTFIGEAVKIFPGSIIGIDAFSFGYKKSAKEKYIKIPSFGGVVLKKGVHVGHNCIIAKGVYKNTVIGINTKINDLSHIGNTVSIGSNTLIMANVDISARVNIGNECWIAQSVCILQGISIGKNVQVGMGSIVTKDIKDNIVAYGQPAKNIRKRK